ncbi:MAG: prephenate dehydrogenase/arogenate dehydrogenase family protein, partial [Alistipes sp.]|nr:prephenate dehydrogenase/arogenate dehydrogenase family protein [Alistipes sp.]
MKVFIAGLGLIGGSLALALRDRSLADEIVGFDASEEHAAEAVRLGIVDRTADFAEGVAAADLTVIATPVDTVPMLAVKALNRVGDRQTVSLLYTTDAADDLIGV